MIAHPISSSTFSLSFLFLFISISLSLLHFKPSIFLSQTLTLNSSQSDSSSSPPIRNNYIVRFLQYKPAEEHRAYLESKIRSDRWKWIERNNPAAKYPTDFGLVSIQESARESVIGEIQRLGLVKDVNADFSYRRRDLLAKKTKSRSRAGASARIGAFVDEKKRPGKIFTAMSFSEDEYHSPISNSSIRWGRQLFMQVILVLSSFFGFCLVRGKLSERGGNKIFKNFIYF